MREVIAIEGVDEMVLTFSNSFKFKFKLLCQLFFGKELMSQGRCRVMAKEEGGALKFSYQLLNQQSFIVKKGFVLPSTPSIPQIPSETI